MIVSEVTAFLKRTPPFDLLDEDTLRTAAAGMQLEFHPKEQVIFCQNGPAAEHLSIIRNGEVKIFVRTNEGEDVMVEYRGPGDSFGLLSIICGDVSRNNIVATEDTSCYLIRNETVLDLMKRNPAVAEFWYRFLLKQLVHLTYTEIHERTLLYGGGDKMLFTNTLKDLATKQVITASQDISIREAAEIMALHKISALVLLDPEGFPVGMVTDRDLRNKVVAKGRSPDAQVSDIMSIALIKSEARDYCFEALLKMIRYNIHHLLVVGRGRISGMITNHDLMMLQGTSPLSVARDIEHQSSIDGLVPAAKRINRVISVLVREGAKANNITRIITEINDRLLKKIIEITEARLGKPPVSYCWIVYGSEGRKEQTFRTDQDNAIIYDDAGERAEDAQKYFSEFALQMKDALERCGIPACTAGYMASNPRWCQPLSVWKKYFSEWINQPTPEAILLSLIFFDFRPVHGNLLLAEQLRAFLGHEAKNKKLFLAHMAGIVVKNRPPLGLFGRFRTEKTGDLHGTLNIKLNALCPIVDAVRLSALEMRVYHASTLERLHELRGRFSTVSEFGDDLEQAFEFLMSLRLRHQFAQIQEGANPDNFINPHNLGVLERKLLKESFKLILRVQEAAKSQYGAGMSL